MYQPLSDVALRQRKAVKILQALAEMTVTPLSSMNCIDIGCAVGIISETLSQSFRNTMGIEYDGLSLQDAQKRAHPGLLFVQADACELPIASESVDIVVCAQVYEHLYRHSQLFEEIWRVLKPNGLCYFSGPNRLFPYEYHWRVPLFHWLPLSAGKRLAEFVKHKPLDVVHLHTYWSLRRLAARFRLIDYTAAMMRDPVRFKLEDDMGKWAWIGRLPAGVLRILARFAPNFNWILEKPGECSGQ